MVKILIILNIGILFIYLIKTNLNILGSTLYFTTLSAILTEGIQIHHKGNNYLMDSSWVKKLMLLTTNTPICM